MQKVGQFDFDEFALQQKLERSFKRFVQKNKTAQPPEKIKNRHSVEFEHIDRGKKRREY
jgi:hypothetical protein